MRMPSFKQTSLALALAGSLSGPVAFAAEDRPGMEHIVLAGGCFWGMEAVFDHVKGVKTVMPGYAGGDAASAHYEMVSTGDTGHAEAVDVTYDPKQVTLQQLLQVYFLAAHNPTELNYQTPDQGTQYRSAIFYATPEQRQIAMATEDEITKTHSFASPIVTKLEPLKQFYPAEEHHVHYAALHPDNGYIVTYDLPRVENLKRVFPELYTANGS